MGKTKKEDSQSPNAKKCFQFIIRITETLFWICAKEIIKKIISLDLSDD